MKRALSLIIVLAMVLCMIPFSAFAAEFEIAGDFADGVITLPAEGELTYLWTATESGTLKIFADAVVPEVAEGEEVPELPEPYILVDGAAYDAETGVEVVAGESYAITFVDDAMIGGDVNVYTMFTGLPGTETNPYEYYNPASGMAPADQAATTVSVESGDSVYYNLWYYGGTTLKISGVGIEAVKVWEDNTIDGTEAGYVEFEIGATERVVLIKITNKDTAAQTYTFEGIVPSGTMNNPEVVTAGAYSVDIAENGEYWYKYVATAAGKLSIGVAATTTVTDDEGAESVVDCWQYTVNPMSGGTTHYCDDAEIVNPETIDVVAGDEVVFVVATYSSTSRPAATVKTTVSFEEAAVEPTTIVIESLPYEATHSGVYEQAYTYTATKAGYLYVASEGWVEMNVGGNVWAEGYGDGYVLAMNEGDVANINLYAYFGEETFTYEFTWLDEVTPDGSYGFPFVAEIPSDGSVVTLANDGEEAVYYVYTATEDCKIYNAFSEDTTDVSAGEELMIYVAPGGIQVNYVLPVAIVDGVNYFDLQEAINAAAEIATDAVVEIKMLTDYVTDGTIIIPANVIVNIATKNLTVGNLFVLSGGNIYADSDGRYSGSNWSVCGKINVAKDNVVITSDAAVITNTSNNMSAIPVWMPNDNCYVFINQRVFDYSYTLDKEAHSVEYKWRMSGSGSFTTEMTNGGLDNGIRYCVKVSWFTGLADVDLSFWYTEQMVKDIAANTSTMATFGLSGLDILGANYAEVEAYDTFEVRACFVTDCGVSVYGLTK